MPKPAPQAAVPRRSSRRDRAGDANGDGRSRADEARQAAEAGIAVVDWIDERTSLSGALRWMLFRKVPKGTNWFYTLGSATMFAFLSQAVTGVFLAMYYDPSPTRAYESIRYITNEAFLGEFVRGMHKWGSTVMVILVFLHMGRMFFFGAYKYPRELNWVIGVVLLILTMTMALHRLPAAVRPALLLGHDRRREHQRHRPAHRPVPVATSCAPGPSSGRRRCRASTRSTCCSCPGLIAALIGAHLYLVAKLGTTAPPWIKAEPNASSREDRGLSVNQREKEQYLRDYSILKSQGKPFFPYAVAKDAAMAAIVLAVIILLSIVLGAELGPKADPTTTTYVPRPEWYFFFLFELLRVIKPPELVAARDDRHADDLHDPAVPAAVLRPQPRAAARAAADRDLRRHPHDRRDGVPDLPRRQRRLAERDRPEAAGRTAQS